MVEKNKSSKQVLHKKVGKSSSSKGEVATAENLVMLETNPGGRGSFKNTLLAKEC